jgi:hypothetical protein
VQIAISYEAKTPSNLLVTIVRNGERYARYETAGPPQEFGVGGVIGLGMGAFDMNGRCFAGRIDDARVYDAALSEKEIADLKPNEPSQRKPWAWWNFEDGKIEDVTGRYESLVFGDPRIERGVLVFDGREDAVVGLRGAAEPGLPKTPPAPKEYAYVYSAGYGEGNRFPTNLVEFEKLVVNLREGGFNTMQCIYKPEYVEICRKHGMKLMVDLIAWKEGAEQDVRRPAQQYNALAICRQARGDDTIWGYNLWNERFLFYSLGGAQAMNGLVLILRKWDPTHPVWVGAYLSWWDSRAITFNPGCPAYYDYPWERGMWLNFHCLNVYSKLSAERDMYFGRWMRNHDYCRSTWTMNTGIAAGMKTGIWFICGPWHPHNPDVFNTNDVLCVIGRDYQKLWPEIGKIGRPVKILSTPTTARDIKRTKDDPDIPIGVPIPPDYPIQVKAGEVLLGHFRYPDGTDALYMANHQYFAPQDMVIEVRKGLTLEMMDRQTGDWNELKPQDGAIRFRLPGAAGQLVRVKGGKLP